MLVVRFLKTSELANSKPCANCIRILENNKKGYKIKDIYYSTDDGTIVKSSLYKLKQDENVHISGFYRNKNSKRWCT